MADALRRLASGLCESGELPAVALVCGRSDVTHGPWQFGRQRPDATDPLPPDALFTVASLTKPVVAMAVLLLVERGRLSLSEKVAERLPEFAGKGRYGVRVRHLLTHTSGLPDQLPHDRDLRRANAPLSRFLADACTVELQFSPGRGVSYSSLGFLLLGEIIARAAGVSLPDFLRNELFAPLGMADTALGSPAEWFDGPASRSQRFAEVRLPAEQIGGDGWNWNSRYWRCFGAPWGGLLSTAADMATFARAMLRPGLFSAATLRAAMTDATATLPDLPELDRRCRPWGLGWRQQWPAHDATFGDLVAPTAVGHYGATGTLLWIDPPRDTFAVILTTRPLTEGGTALIRLSNAAAVAVG